MRAVGARRDIQCPLNVPDEIVGQHVLFKLLGCATPTVSKPTKMEFYTNMKDRLRCVRAALCNIMPPPIINIVMAGLTNDVAFIRHDRCARINTPTTDSLFDSPSFLFKDTTTTGAVINGAVLNIYDAEFIGCDITNCVIKHLTSSSFKSCRIMSMDVGCNMAGVKFIDCVFENVKMMNRVHSDVCVSGVRFNNIDMLNTTIRGLNIRSTTIAAATILRSNMDDVRVNDLTILSTSIGLGSIINHFVGSRLVVLGCHVFDVCMHQTNLDGVRITNSKIAADNTITESTFTPIKLIVHQNLN